MKAWNFPAERCGVRDDLAGALFESDEDAGLPRLTRPLDENLQRQDRLPAARSADEKGCAPARQPAVCQRVEARHEGLKAV